MTDAERAVLRHQIGNHLGVATSYLALVRRDMKAFDTGDPDRNLRCLILAERAEDIATLIRRLAEDIRKTTTDADPYRR